MAEVLEAIGMCTQTEVSCNLPKGCKMRKIFLILLLVLPLYANMRAPVMIKRGASALKSVSAAKMEVLSESLEFDCPAAYTGGVNMALFADSACAARVTYRIRSEAVSVQLAFVYSGTGGVEWQIGGKTFTSKAAALSPQQQSCPHCPQSLEKLQNAVQQLDLATGENTLVIKYRQPLAFTESGHSYFSAGKWRQSITYELWPIAEWQWAPDFHATLRVSIAARDGFLGFGYKEDLIRCYIDEDGKFSEVDLSLSKPSAGARSASARVALRRAPQRLRCEYAAG